MKTIFAQNRKTWIFLLVTLALVTYFLVARPLLGPAGAAQGELILLGALVLALVVVILPLLATLLALVVARDRTRWLRRLRGQMIFMLTVMFLLAVIVAASQWMAYTPPILGDDGESLPNSIASLEKVRLGGVDQWLIIRGHDVNKPVLLFLSGGPGGSEAGSVLHFNQELEKHFVVVIWEQRGCGKSYPSLNPKSALTVDQYVSDIIELTDILRSRFDEDKIYLMGHSWGTIIGVRAAQERPDLFHAYIGTGQMVNVRETDQTIYRMLLQNAHETGDAEFIEQLVALGEPPYFGKSPVLRYVKVLSREYETLELPEVKSEEYKRAGGIIKLALRQPEYGWLDRVYFMLGAMNTFNAVYPQLQDFDFRHDALTLDLPVYFILGRHDVNATYWIAEEYFNLLRAPQKQLFIFEDSGHCMIWQETGKFHDIMINTVLPGTYQR